MTQPTETAHASNGSHHPLPETDEQNGDVIVVKEQNGVSIPSYPWPTGVPKESQGNVHSKPARVFQYCLKLLTKKKSEYLWIPLYKLDSGENAISQHPDLLNLLNQIFKDQLASDYNDSQRSLLYQADVIIICYDPTSDTVVSYGSSMFQKRGSMPGVRYQVNHLGHMIVARGHEKKRLTPLTGATMATYGHTFLELFRTEIILLRSNNRYVEQIINEVPPIYRSDKLSYNETRTQLRELVKAIVWTDKNVFHSVEPVEIGKPSKITHRFPENVTIDGLKNDEIVYMAHISALGLYALRVVRRALKRKSVR